MSNVAQLEKLAAVPGVLLDEPLSKYTTFTVGGPAAFLLKTNDTSVIQTAAKLAREAGLPVAALGGGSNTLVADQGFHGLIILLDSQRCEVHEDGSIDADAGVTLSRVIRAAIGKGYGGLEFAVGIPGSFGGALAGNAGTGGHGVTELATEILYLNPSGELRRSARKDIDVSYRYTRFKYSQDIILAGKLQLQPAAPSEIQARMKEALNRRGWQPKGAWCAGCVFKNPVGNHAGKLIQDAGLKGKKIGGAMVSVDHANFIVNTGTATAEDIIILISFIKQQVRDQFGVQLEEEIRYLGFESANPTNV